MRNFSFPTTTCDSFKIPITKMYGKIVEKRFESQKEHGRSLERPSMKTASPRGRNERIA